MISPKLYDFSPFFLLIFSPLGTADFLMLLELSGDGYSLLCSKKQPPRHSSIFRLVSGHVAGHVGIGKADFVTRKNKPEN